MTTQCSLGLDRFNYCHHKSQTKQRLASVVVNCGVVAGHFLGFNVCMFLLPILSFGYCYDYDAEWSPANQWINAHSFAFTFFTSAIFTFINQTAFLLLILRRFRIDNTDHIIDVNRGNVAYEYDQVDIRCPMYSKGTREEDVESYIIYNVSFPSQLPSI